MLSEKVDIEKEVNNSVSSFIEKREEEEAKLIIEKYLNFPPPRACGYHLVIKLYLGTDEFVRNSTIETTNSVGEKIRILKPDTVKDMEKWRSCTGLVVGMGPDSYTGKRFENSGPWCKVGDWVVFPRHEGTQFNYRGLPMYFLPDDRVYSVIEDPNYVTRD